MGVVVKEQGVLAEEPGVVAEKPGVVAEEPRVANEPSVTNEPGVEFSHKTTSWTNKLPHKSKFGTEKFCFLKHVTFICIIE